jgi:hypothetical protein
MQAPERYAMISARMNVTLIAFPAALLYFVGGLSTGLRKQPFPMRAGHRRWITLRLWIA